MADTKMDSELLEDLYTWVDQIPLSRPKKNIQRDFSDGVLVAEVIQHFLPSYVEMHNYQSCHNTKQKTTNWCMLNRKVFKKLGFEITGDVMDNIVDCKQFAVEQFLMMLRRKMDRHLFEKKRTKDHYPGGFNLSDRPEVDQNMAMKSSSPVSDPPRQPGAGGPRPKHGGSNQDLSKHGRQPEPGILSPPAPYAGTGHPQYYGPPHQGGHQHLTDYKHHKGDVVPKILVEEREQELLVKEETIQILQAKVRRLDHLLHLKDIRIDDLQGRVDRMEVQLRPTAKRK